MVLRETLSAACSGPSPRLVADSKGMRHVSYLCVEIQNVPFLTNESHVENLRFFQKLLHLAVLFSSPIMLTLSPLVHVSKHVETYFWAWLNLQRVWLL